MKHDEDVLVELLAKNLDEYFVHVVLAYQQRLSAFVQRQMGSQQETEDIIQETFIQAYYALDSYPAHRICTLKLHPWLYKIALNIFYNHVRGAKQHTVSLDEAEGGWYLTIEDDVRKQPEVIVAGQESLRELEHVLAELPVRYREVVNLYYFEDFSYQEIADILDIPLGTVKSHLHRSIALLRKALALQEKGMK